MTLCEIVVLWLCPKKYNLLLLLFYDCVLKGMKSLFLEGGGGGGGVV